ncbi:hypothetical protein [Kitasatospora sp. NPDC088346]|uniref:hypothetical protein n=1 Tax=Kitasatospora sp. NPDC088346 TaxID=3364073 RepID=UPI00381A2456
MATLPALLRPVAEALPTTHVFAVGRALAAGHGMPCRELALATGGTALLLAAGMLGLARMLRTFRRRGLITRYSWRGSRPTPSSRTAAVAPCPTGW